jgi:ceramide glucosyltransferase
MTISQCAAAFGSAAASIHALSAMVAAFRCRRRRNALAAPKDAPPVSIVRPLCGLDPFLSETLASTFALDYPSYEIVFCLAHPDDLSAPVARRLIAAHPDIPSRLLIGDDRPSANPKLNNCVKGWKAAAHQWIILADANVMMPKDYIQRLLARWRPDAGIVCAPPVGAAPGSLAAEVECAFLNTYQARWQYVGETFGFGFAQGKTMLWRRDILEAGGGIEALGAEIAEDAAATKLIHRAGLVALLVDRTFEQPLGVRRWREVWMRQVRWARLRRATFPLAFAPELLTTSLWTLAAAWIGAAALDWSPWLATLGAALIWYGSEGMLAFVAGWTLGVSSPLAWIIRDLALPVLFVQAWTSNAFTWRGNEMSVGEDEAPAGAAR